MIYSLYNIISIKYAECNRIRTSLMKLININDSNGFRFNQYR